MRSYETEPRLDPRRIWIPERRIWRPQHVSLSAFGATETVPAGVSFPTQSEFGQTMAGALQSLTELGRGDMSATMTPTGEQAADLLGVAVSAAAGQSLGQLFSSAILPDTVSGDISAILASIVDGIMEMVIETVGAMVADLIGAALDVIPVLGALIGLVIDIIEAIADAASDDSEQDAMDYNEAKGAAQTKRDDLLRPMCSNETSFVGTILPTGVTPEGAAVITPADQFRPIYYRIKTGYPLPISPLSIIVMMCGPESGLMSSDFYEKFMAEARSGQMYDYAEPNVSSISRPMTTNLYTGRKEVRVNRFHKSHSGPCILDDPLLRVQRAVVSPCVVNKVGNNVVRADGVGLKPQVRARMWKLVQAIMSAVQDPYAMTPSWGDGGRSAMIMLTDILFRHYKPIAQQFFGDTDGYWDWYLAKAWEHRIVTSYRVSKSARVNDRCARATGSCKAALADSLLNFMQAYKQPFLQKFVDANGNFRGRPQIDAKDPLMRKIIANRARGVARLELSGDRARRFMNMMARSRSSNRSAMFTGGGELSGAQRALLAAAGLSGSYLAYRGYKHLRRR